MEAILPPSSLNSPQNMEEEEEEEEEEEDFDSKTD